MDHQPELIQEMDALLEAAHLREMRIEPQLRRFARALADLGAPVPKEWATQDDPDVVALKPLTPKQFDRLICLFEDLAAGRPVHITVMRGGPTLFDPGAPSGPSPSPVSSSVHMVVPR
jgi:hypothetical protein